MLKVVWFLKIFLFFINIGLKLIMYEKENIWKNVRLFLFFFEMFGGGILNMI